jgi:CheY-like chemotaxis protein
MMQWDASLLDDDFVSSRHAEQKQTGVQGVRRILLVEDNSINQLIVQKSLSPERFELVCANDGLLGFEAWQNNSFDLILMDIWMPNMDGFQTTQLIRQKRSRARLAA